MIRKLRLKFVAVCMAMVTAVLAVVCFAIFAALRGNVEDLSRQVLHRVIQEEGRQPVMIGDPDHPEVRGIGGWCRNLLVLSGPEAAAKWAQTAGASGEAVLTVVSQTTLRREIYEKTLKILKNSVQI